MYAKILHDFRGMNGDEQLFFIPEGEVGEMIEDVDEQYCYLMVCEYPLVLIKKLSVTILKTCEQCNGEGVVDADGYDTRPYANWGCGTCDGKGWIE